MHSLVKTFIRRFCYRLVRPKEQVSMVGKACFIAEERSYLCDRFLGNILRSSGKYPVEQSDTR